MHLRRPLSLHVSTSLTLVILTSWASTAWTQSHYAASTPAITSSSSRFVTTVEVESAYGKITAFLPNDIRAGEKFSGTVQVKARPGTNARETERNLTTLKSWHFTLGGQAISLDQTNFDFSVPTSGTTLDLAITDSHGRQLAQRAIDLVSSELSTSEPQDTVQLPTLIEANSPFAILRNSNANTGTARVEVGGNACQFLAASPRAFIFQYPGERVGELPIQFHEGSVNAQADVRVVMIRLSAPKTNLKRGEHTTVMVTVEGLDRLKETVPIFLENHSPNVVSMDKGQETIRISPQDVTTGGRYSVQRQVTGVSSGSFTITAVIPQSSEGADWPSRPPLPPQIQFPVSGTFVSGKAQIKAAADPAVKVQKAEFYYRPMKAKSLVLIGTDTDGTDDVFNTFQPAPTGDGWSAYWDTSKVRNGTYELVARMFTSVGTQEARTTVYVTQTPPTPVIKRPRFGEQVSGKVEIFADQGPGVRGVFDVLAQAEIINFPVDPTNQHDYKFDGNHGNSMCDPTSQAAILWKYPKVREKVRAAAAKACKGKKGKDLEACEKKEFIHYLAKKKGTNKDGTDYGNEGTGSSAAIDELGIDGWALVQSGNKSQVGFKGIKNFASQPPGKVKGVLVHVHKKSKPDGTGHVMAVTSISDKKDKDGKYEIHLMDPDSGKEITIHVDDDGNFTYPEPNGSPSFIDSMSKFVGPESDKASLIAVPVNSFTADAGVSQASPAPWIQSSDPPAMFLTIGLKGAQATKNSASPSADEWKVIAIRPASKKGWSAVWDTTGFAPGYYWIRLTVTDGEGHSGSDQTEILLR